MELAGRKSSGELNERHEPPTRGLEGAKRVLPFSGDYRGGDEVADYSLPVRLKQNAKCVKLPVFDNCERKGQGDGLFEALIL